MAKLFANSGDPDQMPHFAVSDLGLHSLPITFLGDSRLKWVKVLITMAAEGILFLLLCPSRFQWGWGVMHIVSALYVCPSGPYVTKMVSIRYLLKRLMYWIHILYTGV